MNHVTTASSHTQTLSSRIATAAVALTLGIIMLAGVGFVQGNNNVVHNATHDTRHGMSFPCH